MKVQIDTSNHFELIGRIIRVNTYGKGNSAANVVIGVKGDDSAKSVKFFTKEVIPLLREKMPVHVVGHIGSNCYTDATGKKQYRDNNDLIADVIDIIESKTDSKTIEMEKLYS